MKKKKSGIILLVLSIVCVLCAAVHRKNDISDRQEDNWQNHLGELEEDVANPAQAVQTDDTEILAISSEDNKYTIFVKRGNPQKLYIYNAEEKKLDQIDVTPDLADQIMTLEWIGRDQVAVWSHATPSVGCLDIYDVNRLQKLAEKYCTCYSLTEDIDTLVYVDSISHYSSAIGNTRILNMDDEILYQTEKNEIITSIDCNGKDIAIVVEKVNVNYEAEATDLLVLKRKGKKYKTAQKIGLKDGEGREIHWINPKTISYSTRKDGVNKTWKIAK